MARVAFIQYFWREKVGLMYISALLKKRGHRCEVFLGSPSHIEEGLRAYNPHIVGFYCVTGMQAWVKKMASFIKNKIDKSILIAAGGPHPTFFPEMIEEENIDIICRGEGEHPMAELADNLDSKKDITAIKNLWIKAQGKIFRNDIRPLIQDLDQVNFPDRELYSSYEFIAKSPYRNFITSRGCVYNCTFCYNHAFRKLASDKGKYMRRRSVDNVIEELTGANKKYNLKSVIFLDDNFILAPKDWLFSFFERYKQEVKKPFFCLLRADLIDEDLVRALKNSGCYWIEMGVESGRERYRNMVLKKELSDYHIIRAAGLLHKYNINFNTTNMMGLPGETLDDAIHTLRFNAALKPKVAWCSLFQPYPKTELGEFCLKEGLIDRLDGENIDVHSHTYSILKQEGMRQIINLHKFAHLAAKFPFILPLVRLCIKLPPNKAFVLLNRLTFLMFYWSGFHGFDLKRALQEAVIAYKNYEQKNS